MKREATRAPFGGETTAADYRARACWEREQAEDVRERPWGEPLAEAHMNSATAFEAVALELDFAERPPTRPRRPSVGRSA